MIDRFDIVRSSIAGLTWPGVPAGGGPLLLAMQFQLEQTQWWPPERLRRGQYRQLALLLKHAYETVPFQRERLEASGYRPGGEIDDGAFAALPRLTRAQVQAYGDALHSRNVPREHAPFGHGQTSGSTGTPVNFLTTAVTRLFWDSLNLRDHLWHRRNFSLKLVTIRPDRGARDDRGQTARWWGESIAEIYENGPSAILHSSNPIDRQIEWLVEQNPDYLLTLASNLHELARELHRRGIRLERLIEARTFGDCLRAEARAECKALLGVKVVDMYTSQESGYIALQCPEHDHYHAQGESVIVEILDDAGNPCAEGAIGKVTITTLHNYAMPLIRYEIGDYAEAGGPCPCGRGLPVIRRVLGRERNLALAPDGRKFYPSFAAEIWSRIAPIRQIQLVQRASDHIDVRFAADRDLESAEKVSLSEALQKSLGHPYRFGFERLEQIPRAASGKYEDFICEVGARA